MSVLMGANIANEVAEEKFCETTIGNEFEITSDGDTVLVETRQLSAHAR